jgi:hypothetical protein
MHLPFGNVSYSATYSSIRVADDTSRRRSPIDLKPRHAFVEPEQATLVNAFSRYVSTGSPSS